MKIKGCRFDGSPCFLVILAIAVLGFAALQFRALDAVQEANDRTTAMTLARDLAEKIRVNRTQLSKYKSEINALEMRLLKIA
jgi:type IV pilus assembly protein PilV